MASSIMHLAMCSLLEKSLPIDDLNAFRIGHILPDAVLSADKAQANSHFIKLTNGGKRKYFDFHSFYGRFKELIFSDCIFLGYYFHLIQDNLFRSFMYADLGLLHRRGTEGFLEELYRDYHILNGILVKKYSLTDNIQLPQNFSESGINEIYRFELTDFLEMLKRDFKDNFSDKPVHFAEEAVYKYIQSAAVACEKEYKALRDGKHFFSEYELAFNIV